ncbi:MAG: hypothetical protein ACR2KX_02735 [Chitinophagaceae bacterium]
MMTSRDEAKKNNSGDFGYTLRLGKEDNFETIGISGGLQGYSSFLYYYPQKDVTIIVLSNTSGQMASAIGRRIARNMLGLTQVSARETSKKLIADLPVLTTEILRMTGTYVVQRKPTENSAPSKFNLFKRTLRAFVENDRLMIQRFGELPLPLLKQNDENFMVKYALSTLYSFKTENGDIVINITNPGTVSTGKRIGNADVKTFRNAAFENMK